MGRQGNRMGVFPYGFIALRRDLNVKIFSFPQVGDIAYLIHRAVIVKEVLEEFNIIKICYVHSCNEFYTDVSSISKIPDFGINTLDINLF